MHRWRRHQRHASRAPRGRPALKQPPQPAPAPETHHVCIGRCGHKEHLAGGLVPHAPPRRLLLLQAGGRARGGGGKRAEVQASSRCSSAAPPGLPWQRRMACKAAGAGERALRLPLPLLQTTAKRPARACMCRKITSSSSTLLLPRWLRHSGSRRKSLGMSLQGARRPGGRRHGHCEAPTRPGAVWCPAALVLQAPNRPLNTPQALASPSQHPAGPGHPLTCS